VAPKAAERATDTSHVTINLPQLREASPRGQVYADKLPFPTEPNYVRVDRQKRIKAASSPRLVLDHHLSATTTTATMTTANHSTAVVPVVQKHDHPRRRHRTKAPQTTTTTSSSPTVLHSKRRGQSLLPPDQQDVSRELRVVRDNGLHKRDPRLLLHVIPRPIVEAIRQLPRGARRMAPMLYPPPVSPLQT